MNVMMTVVMEMVVTMTLATTTTTIIMMRSTVIYRPSNGAISLTKAVIEQSPER